MYSSTTGAFNGEQVTEVTVNSTTSVYGGNTITLGKWHPSFTSGSFQGSIDLNECYININGSRWWSGRMASGFTEESTWEQSVDTYGVCGKFVYDSVANTVRLPKITGIVEGTTDVTALGDLVEAGLPNITGQIFGSGLMSDEALWLQNGALYQDTSTTTSYDCNRASSSSYGLGFNAARSSAIYGNSSTVQPQTIKCYYYIVIATSTKTEIEVDIDEVATDLNGKCDTDLSNMAASASAKNTVISWGMPDYAAGVSVSSYTSSSNQFTAPCDGIVNWGANRANSGIAYINGLRWNTYYGINATLYSNCTIPLNKGDKFYATSYSDSGDLCNLFFPMKGAS